MLTFAYAKATADTQGCFLLYTEQKTKNSLRE